MVLMKLLLVSVFVSLVLGRALTQEYNFVREQVCYFPDIELVREDALSQLRVANVSGSVFDFARNSTCNGLAIRIEACVRANSSVMTDPPVTIFRFFATPFTYDPSTRLYHQKIDFSTAISAQLSDFNGGNVACFDDSLMRNLILAYTWFIEEGDVLKFSSEDDCMIGLPSSSCPADVVFEPMEPTIAPTKTVEYQTLTTSDVRRERLTTAPGFINARAFVIPTPPPLPENCRTASPQGSCREQSSENIVIGEMESSPAPDRRFWGGGTYIMPQRVPVDGRALSMSYTALLNTQGQDIINFQFRIGFFRISDEVYTVVRSTTIDIASQRPILEPNSFEATISSQTFTFPNSWEVLEGDQFFVTIPIECSSFCPLNVAILSKEENCQYAIYRPVTSESNSFPSRISLADEFLSEVPISINIRITIAPNNESLAQEIPLCTGDMFNPTTSDVTQPTTPSMQTSTIRAGNPQATAFIIGGLIGGLVSATVIIILLLVMIIILVLIMVKKGTQRKKEREVTFEIEACRAYDMNKEDPAYQTIADVAETPANNTLSYDYVPEGNFNQAIASCTTSEAVLVTNTM